MAISNRMAQIYGYIVCLVAVITFIICLANIIPAIIDLSDPLSSGSDYWRGNAPSLASFDNYKMDILKSADKEGAGSQSFIPDDKTLERMYEAAKTERINSVKHSAIRSIIVNSILILVCIILFTTHWIWMRRLSKKMAAD